MPSSGLSKYIETKLCRPLAFNSYKDFLENKKISGIRLPV